MAKKKKKQHEDSALGKIVAWTFMLALTFSAGLITGQRFVRHEAMPPLVSVRTVPPVANEGAAEPLKTTFSFYEKLNTPEVPVVKAPQPSAAKSPEKPPTNEKPKKPKVSKEKIDLKNAPAKVAKELKAVVDPEAAPEALPARYTLQIGSHPTKKAATQQLKKLKSMGYEAHLISVDVPQKGTLFRVRIGKFHAMDEARNYQSDLKRSNGLSTFVTPL